MNKKPEFHRPCGTDLLERKEGKKARAIFL